MPEVQAVLFDRPTWTAPDARKWLAKNGRVPIKRVHKTPNELRYRLADPALFARFATKVLPGGVGIKLTIGWPATDTRAYS
jgi:hypothetical protein